MSRYAHCRQQHDTNGSTRFSDEEADIARNGQRR